MTDPLDLHALADGELNREDASRVRESLRSDEALNAEYNAILNLKDCMRDKTLRFDSEDAWRACRGRMDAIDRTKRVEGLVTRYAWAICAFFFVMILSGRYATQGTQGAAAQISDIGALAGTVRSQNAPDLRNAAATNRWLDQMLGDTRQSIAMDRLTVLGGGVGEWQGMKVKVLDLQDNNGRLQLMIIPANLNLQDTAAMPGTPKVYAGNLGSSNCVAWSVDGSKTLILIARRPYDELQTIASRINAQKK